MPYLLRLTVLKVGDCSYSFAPFVVPWRPAPRHQSMCEGDSTLITSAAKSPNRHVAIGPAQPLVRSTIRSGLVMVALLTRCRRPASAARPSWCAPTCHTRPLGYALLTTAPAVRARAVFRAHGTAGPESSPFPLADARSQENAVVPSSATIPRLLLVREWERAESPVPGSRGRCTTFPVLACRAVWHRAALWRGR